MFIELLAPPLCAACAAYGGLVGGLTIANVDVGAGSINQGQNDGQIEHDTVFMSLSGRVFRADRFAIGAWAAGTFNPTPEPRRQPRSLQAGPFAEYQVYGPVAIRLYGVPDSRNLAHSQLMFSFRVEVR